MKHMMNDLANYLEKDLPRINEFIESEIDRLDPSIRDVARHVLCAGGKRLRPTLTLITARCLNAPPELDLMPLACSLEFLHSATLLHDDILDGSVMRRGRKAAHLVYGRRETVLAGDVLLALANRLVSDYGDSRVIKSMADAIMGTAAGEVREISRTRDTTLSRDEYLEIIMDKTALLFECACHGGALVAGANDPTLNAAGSYGLNLGIAFQIVDDAMDYAESPDITGKPRAGDLREGKMTLPLILLLESMPEDARKSLEHKITADELGDADVRAVLSAAAAGNFAEAARKEAAVYADKAREALKSLPDNRERELMDQIIGFVLNRNR
jgi:octaprenyl-diphosphate synthase